MKLTAAEKKWLAELQDVLARSPSKRLGFYTIGDAIVSIYDSRKEAKINKLLDDNDRLSFPLAVREAGACVDDWLIFPARVHSVSG